MLLAGLMMPSMNSKPMLWLLFVLQAVCAAFFLGDGIADLFGEVEGPESGYSDQFEYIIAIVLLISVIVTGLQLGNVLKRQRRLEDQLKIASGAFADLLDEHFVRWGLTPSEREVALLAIKGYSIAEMSNLRQTREGTIKTQCNAIYRKAGVSGRPQLLSYFIEELMADGLPNS